MSKVQELVLEVKTNLSQTSSSQRDEIAVMRSMMNDTSYEVGIYSTEGMVGVYCPAKEVRNTFASVLSSAAKVPMQEATKLMDNYEFKKPDAATMVDLSKEFINTFLQTGRKLPLGSREKSNVSLSLKQVEATTRSYPKKVGIAADGSPKYEKANTSVPEHQSIKVHASCPAWVK